MKVKLQKVIVLHRRVYFSDKGVPKLHTDQETHSVEGTTCPYMWDVRKNKVYRCYDGKRKLIQPENIEWVKPC